MNVLDRLRYAPSREQWRSDEHVQHGSYRLRRLYAIFGITSARWALLTRENKRGE